MKLHISGDFTAKFIIEDREKVLEAMNKWLDRIEDFEGESEDISNAKFICTVISSKGVLPNMVGKEE